MSHSAPVAKIILTFCALAALGGCGFLPEDPRPKNHAMLPPVDLSALLDGGGDTHTADIASLSVYDAIALGLQSDLDRKTAALQHGALIPASYSPEGQTPWTALDAGIGYARGKTSGAYDYRRKAAASIVQEVRFAWTRAASAALLKQDLEAAIVAAQTHLSGTPDSDLERQLETLKSLRQQLGRAGAELAALIAGADRPPDISSVENIETDPVPSLAVSVEELEIAALLSRPEIREGPDNTPVSVEELRDSVLKTFPNIGEMLGRATSPGPVIGEAMDRALDQARWKNFSTTFTQSLIRIFTLPLRLEDDQNRHTLERLRQQAMSAAILAQVHLAHSQYLDAHRKFLSYRTILGRIDAIPPVGDENAALRLSLTKATARARLHLAYAELLSATARLMDAVGLGLIPENIEGLTPHMLAGEAEKRLKSAEYSLVYAAADGTGGHKAPVPSGGNHAILSAEKLISPLKAGIEPAVYRQDQGVTMWQASLSRPAFLIPSTRIPLAQKVSAQTIPSGLVPATTGESETLRIPERQTKALLDAPLSDAP